MLAIRREHASPTGHAEGHTELGARSIPCGAAAISRVQRFDCVVTSSIAEEAGTSGKIAAEHIHRGSAELPAVIWAYALRLTSVHG